MASNFNVEGKAGKIRVETDKAAVAFVLDYMGTR
jgi:hypothetical protein